MPSYLQPPLCFQQFRVSRADLPTAALEELLGPVDDGPESMLAMAWAVICLHESPSEHLLHHSLQRLQALVPVRISHHRVG